MSETTREEIEALRAALEPLMAIARRRRLSPVAERAALELIQAWARLKS